MVAVDVTGSMAVKDAEDGSSGTISRLDAAKRIVKGITSTYADSSFAALRFGASGTLDVPLTPDSIAIDGWADTLAESRHAARPADAVAQINQGSTSR